jgi:hypothetical protein
LVVAEQAVTPATLTQHQVDLKAVIVCFILLLLLVAGRDKVTGELSMAAHSPVVQAGAALTMVQGDQEHRGKDTLVEIQIPGITEQVVAALVVTVQTHPPQMLVEMAGQEFRQTLQAHLLLGGVVAEEGLDITEREVPQLLAEETERRMETESLEQQTLAAAEVGQEVFQAARQLGATAAPAS